MSSQYNSPQNKYLDLSNKNPASALAGILQCCAYLEKNLNIIAICSITHSTATQLYLRGDYSMASSWSNLIQLLFIWQLDTKIARRPIYNTAIRNTH